jgi:LysM repeat protein
MSHVVHRIQTSGPVRSRLARISSYGILFGALAMLLAGCFQAAGNPVEPTIANLTATSPAPALVPTLPPPQAQPTALPEQPTVPALAPTFTPFITPIGDQGFQTPTPTTAGAAEVGATTVLFPPTVNPAAAQPTAQTGAIPTIAAPTAGGPTPDALATPTALPTDPPCNYTVQQGDTFYAISRKLKINPEDLIRVNPRANPNALQIGDVLNVPGCEKPTSPAPAGATTAPGAPQTYTIQAGDTLGRIATRFGVTVQELVKANNFANESVILNIGQVITIPAKP